MNKLVKAIAIALLIVVVGFGAVSLHNYRQTFVKMDGTSMVPTIQPGQVVRVHPYPKGQLPQRGDLVEYSSPEKIVLQYAQSGKLIHRIIALPGERITISNNKVLVYNKQHPNGFNPDTFLSSNVVTAGNINVTLEPNMYYVLGDNRPDSLDSRYTGPVPLKDIIGKVTP
jgi:signal peptidase I